MRAAWCAILAMAAGAACGAEGRAPSRPVTLAATTTVEDSGLLEALVLAFREAHPDVALRTIVVSSGEALELGRRGDADVLLVHSPAAESAFVAAGHGRDRRELMYNDFVVVGPPADPAGVRGLEDAAKAFARIAAAGASFLSRGDDSGTHARERALWAAAGISPRGEWYREAGQGMGEVLRMASELEAYTLTDRATYRVLRDGLALGILVEGDERLRNIYAALLANRARHPAGGATLLAWLGSETARELIAGYGIDAFGRPLFIPIELRD